MTNNLFESLKAIYLEEQRKNPVYLQSFKEDLDEYDRDVLTNDTMHGQHWIAILKDTGSGTYLNRCFSKSEESNTTFYRVSTSSPECKFYHIESMGHNKGVITEVSKAKALSLSTQFEDPPGYRPRRITIYQKLEELLGLRTPVKNKSIDRSIWNTSFKQYIPNDGEITALKVSADSNLKFANLEIVRTKVNPANSDKELIQSHNVPIDLSEAITFKNPKYFRMDMVKAPYAELTEITKPVYEKALKAVTKQKNKELTM